MIQEYKLKDGSKRYLVKVYLGLDSLTGKRITTTRRGYKTKKEAVLMRIMPLKIKMLNIVSNKYTSYF